MFFFFYSSALTAPGVMKDQCCSASEPAAAADVEKGQRACLHESSEPARRQQDGLVMVCQLAATCQTSNCGLFKSG